MAPSSSDSESEQLLTRNLYLSDLAALMHLLKGYIGIGILALPWALKYAGIIVGPVCLVVLALASAYSMLTLVDSARHLSKKLGTCSLDYGEVVYYAVLFGPIRSLQKHAKKAKLLLNICMVLALIGFCSAYVVFVAQNLRQVVAVHFSTLPGDRAFIAMLWLPLTLTVFIRKLPVLAWLSTLANIALVTSLSIIFTYLFTHIPAKVDVLDTASIADFPIFFGSATFALEGIALVLPIRNVMREPGHFGKVLVCGTSIALAISLLFCVVGYIVFGSKICSSLTLNLPPNEILYESARILHTFMVFASFPLQFHVLFQILWPAVEDKFRPQKIFCELISRAGAVAIICAMSIAIPNMGDIDSLVGAAVTTSLQFIFPPIIQLMVSHTKAGTTCYPELIEIEMNTSLMESRCEDSGDEDDTLELDSHSGLGVWTMATDIVIIAVGIVGVLTGTAAAIINIIKHSENYSASAICNGGVAQTISSRGGNKTTSLPWTTFHNESSKY